MDQESYQAIASLAEQYRAGQLTPPVYAARYVLCWQFIRHGKTVAQRRSRQHPKPDGAAWLAQLDSLSSCAATTRLIEILERYDLRRVSRRVGIALAGWLRGTWPLTLHETVPSAREILRMQIHGTRAVTVIADYPRLVQPIEDKPDAFAFVCHDLEHAWQFFHDPEWHVAQRRFAYELDGAIEHGVFADYLHDPLFEEKFNYLAADMNTHVAHSIQYLRAILLECLLRFECKGPREQLSDGARERLTNCLANFSEPAVS